MKNTAKVKIKNNVKIVLVVEDDAALNRAITLKLQSQGYKVASCLNAEEAIKLLEADKEKYHFIWLDLLLPGMTGLEFLKWLRSQTKLKDEKVAVVSVSWTHETQNKARELGVVDYIIKSEYNLKDVVKRIVSDIDNCDQLAAPKP